MNILVTSMIDLQKSSHNSRLHQFLKYLSIKHSITVVSINDNWKEKYELNSEKYNDDFAEVYNKIQICHYTDKTISPIIQEVIYSFNIEKSLAKLDLSLYDVHFNYNGLCGGYALAKALKKYSIPTIYDIADDLPAMIRSSPQIPHILRSFGGKYGDYMFQKNIRIADKVTVTTNDLGAASNVPLSKLVVLPNGVDTTLFQPINRDEIRKNLHLDNSLVIGYVGVLREWVDFEPMFSAINELSSTIDVKILIVGGGSGYAATKELVHKYGLEKLTTLTGTIPYSKVPEYISAMDICTIPFKTDQVSKNSLPLKLFEYMSCEKPVISSKIDIVVKEMSDYVLCAESADEYVSAIRALSNDYETRKQMGKNGHKFVEKNYTWDSISASLEKILLEVCK